jgi:hypothetical protein
VLLPPECSCESSKSWVWDGKGLEHWSFSSLLVLSMYSFSWILF